MARWDKFLEGASRGYGLGFHRYQLYDEANRERQNRADAAAAYEAYQQAIANPTTQFQNTGAVYGPGPSVADIKAAQTAVPTGDMANQRTSYALPQGEIPSASAQGRTVPYPQMAPSADAVVDNYASTLMTPPEAPAAAPAAPPPTAARRGVNPKAGQMTEADWSSELQNAKAAGASDADLKKVVGNNPTATAALKNLKQPPASAVVVDETKANKTAEAAAALGEIIPNVPRKALTQGERELTGDANARQQHWNTMRDKMAAIYARSGDLEGMMTLDTRIQQMQHERMLSGLEDAIRLAQVDPEAAARSLYKAYSYFPDGVDVKIAIRDGQLVGYGYDEVTGKFRGQMQLTPQALSNLYESIKDPVAFNTRVRAEKIAAEERAYEREKDNRQFLLDTFEAKSTAILDQAKAFESTMQGLKYYAENMGYDTAAAASWGNLEEGSYQKYLSNSMKAFQDRSDGVVAMSDNMLKIYTEIPTARFTVSQLTSDIAGNTSQYDARAPEVNAQLAEQIFVEEARVGPTESRDSATDRMLDAARAQVPVNVGAPQPDGKVDVQVGNQVVTISAIHIPNLLAKRKAMLAQQQPGAAPAPTAGAPTAPALPVDQTAQGVAGREAQFFKDLLALPVPENKVQGVGRIAMER